MSDDKFIVLIIVLTIFTVMFFEQTNSKHSLIKFIKKCLVPYEDASPFVLKIYPYIFFGGWWVILYALYSYV